MAVDLTPPPTRQRRTSTAKTPGTSTPAKTPSQEMDAKTQERKEGLDQYVQTGVALLMLTRQYADAQATAMHGPKVTTEVAKLCNRYEKMAGAIDKAIAAGPLAGLITASLPWAMQLAVNHGLIRNPGVLAGMGVQPKEVLEAEGQKAERDMILRAIEAQRQYEQEQAAFNAELAEFRSAENGKAG
jgi:hypothetical protein